MTGRYDPKWVEKYYDEYGENEWERMVKSPTHEVRLHVHRHYLEQYIREGDHVLEIGPGPGRFTQVLEDIGAKLVLVDISAVQLELNKQHALEGGFEDGVENRLQLDMCDMGVLGDETFDVVVCYGGAVSYVFEKRDEAMREMLRVLRPGGVVLIGAMSIWGALHEFLPGTFTLPAEENICIVETGDLCPETYSACNHHAHLFRAKELREFLEGFGVTILAMSASNMLSAAWRERLTEIREDPAQWEQMLDMELRACREPGLLDAGTHIIAVVRTDQ